MVILHSSGLTVIGVIGVIGAAAAAVAAAARRALSGIYRALGGHVAAGALRVTFRAVVKTIRNVMSLVNGYLGIYSDRMYIYRRVKVLSRMYAVIGASWLVKLIKRRIRILIRAIAKRDMYIVLKLVQAMCTFIGTEQLRDGLAWTLLHGVWLFMARFRAILCWSRALSEHIRYYLIVMPISGLHVCMFLHGRQLRGCVRLCGYVSRFKYVLLRRYITKPVSRHHIPGK